MSTIVTALATFVDPAQGMRVEAMTGSGFRLEFDTVPGDEGGVAAGPTETVLAALAACTSMDVASILRKKRQPVERYQIAVTGERAAEHPKVYTSITVEHRVLGAVSAETVRRSVELSATAYCPVSAMLSASVPIEHRYRLQQSADAEAETGVVVVTGPATAS
jgi:putative redox protein